MTDAISRDSKPYGTIQVSTAAPTASDDPEWGEVQKDHMELSKIAEKLALEILENQMLYRGPRNEGPLIIMAASLYEHITGKAYEILT